MRLPVRTRSSMALLAAAALAFGVGAGCGGGGGGGGGGGATTGAQQTGSGAAAPALRAGAAAVNITPGPGVPLGGFGGDPRRVFNVVTIPLQVAAAFGHCYDPDPSDAATFFAPNQGVHDPLTARALVLELANGRKAAIVKIDAIGVSGRLRRDIEAFAGTLGIPPELLLVTATHTHSGPGAVSELAMWQLVAMDCLNDQVYRNMLAGIEASISLANASLRPAELGIGVGQETRASRNRAGRPGVVDHELAIIKVTEPGGAPIACVVNFAVHGTCLGESNMLFSADVMGFTESAVEQRIGGGVALFVNAAEGDVSPTQGGFQGAQNLGQLIAETAAQVWSQTATKPSVELRGAYEVVTMPTPTFNAACPPIPGTQKDLCNLIPGFSLQLPLSVLAMPFSLPFQALRIDDCVIGTVPGEPITEIGLDIKNAGQARGFRHTLVAGLANDHCGYVTTEAEYNRGRYEAMATLFGPTTGQIVVQSIAQQMDRVR